MQSTDHHDQSHKLADDEPHNCSTEGCRLNRDSFAHRPDANKLIPLRGIKNLIVELKQRIADRDYYYKLLSLMHTSGIKQSNFETKPAVFYDDFYFNFQTYEERNWFDEPDA